MAFAVNSTSLETKRMARVIRVAQRRDYINGAISSVGVYNCRKTAGSDLWSAHAVGDAGDFMRKVQGTGPSGEEVAQRIIKDATEKTVANLGRPTEAIFVIWQGADGVNRQWVKGQGITPYTGESHASHVHVGCSYSFHSTTFNCGDRLPGVAYI